MSTDLALKILVIILSTFLALFLILAIAALVKVIQLLKTLKRIAAKAEMVADRAEAASALFEKTAGPMAVGKFIANIVNLVKRGDKKSKKR